MHSRNFRTLLQFVTAAFFLALIFVATYFLHIPWGFGYIHPGDAFLYLAASLLPTPFAVAAGSIGEALSDATSGYAVFVIPTLVVKALMALCFTAAGARILSKRNLIACGCAGLVCIVGYYFAECIMYHSMLSPLADIPGNVVQAAASAAIFLLLGKALDSLGFKKRMANYSD